MKGSFKDVSQGLWHSVVFVEREPISEYSCKNIQARPQQTKEACLCRNGWAHNSNITWREWRTCCFRTHEQTKRLAWIQASNIGYGIGDWDCGGHWKVRLIYFFPSSLRTMVGRGLVLLLPPLVFICIRGACVGGNRNLPSVLD